MKHVAMVVLLTSLAACASGGARRPMVTPSQPASAPEDRLRGTWDLVELQAQGHPRRAAGNLTVDEFRNFALHVELDPGEPGVTPPRTVLLDFRAKATVAAGDEITYLGLERQVPPERMMISATEPVAWRHFAIEGDTLRLWQTDESGRPVGTLTFKRVP